VLRGLGGADLARRLSRHPANAGSMRTMQFCVRGFAGEILHTVTVKPLREWLKQRTVLALPGFQRVEVKA
jgi:hypothetical protein